MQIVSIIECGPSEKAKGMGATSKMQVEQGAHVTTGINHFPITSETC